MPKAVAFVATLKPREARRFYEEVLGCRFLHEHDFAIVLDAFGTTLRIQKAPSVTPAPYTAFGLDVEDIEAFVTRLEGHGVRGVRYPHFTQDARGIWTAPGGAKVFWFHDPDGNLLSLSQG
jgi:catechol 2,3-dioxygenase-like lactoylglutathione lyase family enzyme